jgi:uncharacterized protein
MNNNGVGSQLDSKENDAFNNQQQDLINSIDKDIIEAGGALNLPKDGRVGVTMFDSGGSKDNEVTVVVPRKDLSKVPSQALVRIESAKKEDGGDGRIYQGIVTAGPFYEPDGLKGDASIILTTAAHGVTFMPKYHGRVKVEILGEVVEGGTIPPRFRPLPNSPVFPLDPAEAKEALKLDGDITLGSAIGHKDMEIKIPADTKSVLPRHVGILGTTGGGKSTTVSGIVNHFQKANIATILVDTEGEYTHIDQPTEDKNMLLALERRGLKPEGVKKVQILKLVGRESTNPKHSKLEDFTLSFSKLSPYAVMEILDFSEAQQQRYLKAYDIAKTLLNKFGIFPANDIERDQLFELDELQSGYPRLTLAGMYDVVSLCGMKVGKEDLTTYRFREPRFIHHATEVFQVINANEKDLPTNVASWRAIRGLLSRFLRLQIFDNPNASTFNFKDLTTPGKVTIVDLHDTDSPAIRNLVIADLLSGLMDEQNQAHSPGSTNNEDKKVMVVLEEAHEFLSSQRIKQMPTLYDQVARIARRGRKRWLGLTFVTQLPQHLPDEVLALINNFILHKISDAGVISRLKRSIGSVDESMWNRLPSLSSGQAVVTFTHMRRAMLTAIDPTPSKLLMVE